MTETTVVFSPIGNLRNTNHEMELSSQDLRVLVALRQKELTSDELAALWNFPSRAVANGYTARLSTNKLVEKVEVYRITAEGIRELVLKGLDKPDAALPITTSANPDSSQDLYPTKAVSSSTPRRLIHIPKGFERLLVGYPRSKYKWIPTQFDGTFVVPLSEPPPLLDTDEEVKNYAQQNNIRKNIPYKPTRPGNWKFCTDINVWRWIDVEEKEFKAPFQT